jgi:signal transduction histidine kinase
VRQILDNLVSNAVKFTYPGGRIAIEAQPLVEDTGEAPMHCTIEVSDTGIGISQEEQAHIWERIYRSASPQAEGAATRVGMGLSVVKSLAEAHGGRVWMESMPSVGSTFTVLLPIRRAQIADRQGS